MRGGRHRALAAGARHATNDATMVPLTEKLLADAGGWAALKEARALFAAGRVLEARYEPPNLTGRVRGGETEYRAGLRIASKTDIENTCTCPESRRRAVVCAHSLAVGLAVLAPPKPAVEPAGSGSGTGKLPAAMEASPFSTTDGEACAWHV